MIALYLDFTLINVLIKNTFHGLTHLRYLSLINTPLMAVQGSMFTLESMEYIGASFGGVCCLARLTKVCNAPHGIHSTCEDLITASLKIPLWVTALSSTFLNIFVLFYRLSSIRKSRHASQSFVAQNLLIINLALADGLMSLYLVGLGSVQMYYKGQYSFNALLWT